MAHKRQRGESWEFVVKRAGVLDKPLTLTFPSEAEGEEYCRKLEALLDRGIVPTEYKPKDRVRTLGTLINQYLHEVSVPGKDAGVLATVSKELNDVSVLSLDANWVDEWVTTMKREKGYAPATIHAKVGALARCCDWGMRKKLIVLPDHPLRTLRNGYANYTKADAAFTDARQDEERDRRLEGDEEQRIRAVLDGGVLSRKQRPYKIEHLELVKVLFDLALESAMRLREMYTLTVDQINIAGATVFLNKTKNGDSRQVPLTSVAVRVLAGAIADRPGTEHIFPWLAEQKGSLKFASNYVSKLFAAIFDEAGCGDFRFHDLRHEAISRLFERSSMTVEEVMKMSGHRTHRMMMRYLKLRSSNMAAKLW